MDERELSTHELLWEELEKKEKEKTFSKRPDVLLVLLSQIFRHRKHYSFKMRELEKCLKHGLYTDVGTRYIFEEKNWYRSIGKAIKILQEIGYEIIHENKSYTYISNLSKDFYQIITATNKKQLIQFDYRKKEGALEYFDIEKINKKIKGKSFEELSKIYDEYKYYQGIEVSPYGIHNGKLLCGKKSGKDTEKLYDFYEYDLDRILNIKIIKPTSGKRYYSLDKAVAKLPDKFSVDARKCDKIVREIVEKKIASYKRYAIYSPADKILKAKEEDLLREFKQYFEDVVVLKLPDKYFIEFTYHNEEDVFNFILKKKLGGWNFKFKKVQQQRFDEWFAQYEVDKAFLDEFELDRQKEKEERKELRIQKQKEREEKKKQEKKD